MCKFQDLTGKKFGILTVLRVTEKKLSISGKREYWYWLCKCECGGEREFKGEVLKARVKLGNVSSCGCIKSMISQAHTLTDSKDLEGMKFGKLTVVRRDFQKLGEGTHCFYLCRCECGNEKILNSQDIKRSKSCGCLQKEWRHGGFKEKYCTKKK